MIQKAVVCISFSGNSSFPSPTFSFVKNLIFLNPTTCDRTSTSPCARALARVRDSLFFGDGKNAHLRVADRVRVVIHIHRFHVSLALIEIQPLDVVLLTLMKVNRLRVHRGKRAEKSTSPITSVFGSGTG